MNKWEVRTEENEYVVMLVLEKPCNNPDCSCNGNGYTTEYEIVERKSFKKLPQKGSLEEKQLKWILSKIADEDNLGPFPL
jgi:hypothetical protein